MEVIPAEIYDELVSEYIALWQLYQSEQQNSFYRRPAKVRPPRVEVRERLAPLDVAKEDYPL